MMACEHCVLVEASYRDEGAMGECRSDDARWCLALRPLCHHGLMSSPREHRVDVAWTCARGGGGGGGEREGEGEGGGGSDSLPWVNHRLLEVRGSKSLPEPLVASKISRFLHARAPPPPPGPRFITVKY